MARITPHLFLLSVILLFHAASSLAQDGKGRLPDGRAFRTDSQGNQLVDYIAELELMNDALRRQVSGLEVEVQEKQALVEKSQRGDMYAPVLERNLLAESPKADREVCKATPCDCSELVQRAVKDVEIRSKQAEKEFLYKINATHSSNSEALARAQQTIDRLTNEAVQKETLLKSYEQKIAHDATASREMKGVLLAKNNELEALRVEAQSVSSEVADLEKRRAQLSSERETLQTQIAALERVVAEKRLQVAAINTANDEVKHEPAGIDREDTLLAVSKEIRLDSRPQQFEGMRASYGMMRDSAFDSLRGKMNTTLNQIQGVVATRDRMYSEYAKGAHAVAFNPAAPRSSKGNSISDLKAAIQDAQSARELSLLTREMNEIRSKVEFDIGMMERVKRLR